MNFLLDENTPVSILKLLVKRGHRVYTLQELKQRGITNGEVCQLAINKQAIIITFDRDFLQLNKSVQKKVRIIYFNLNPTDPKLATALLEKHFDFCVLQLKNTGAMLISESECKFKPFLD